MTYEDRLDAFGARLKAPDHVAELQACEHGDTLCSCLANETTCVLCGKDGPLKEGLCRTGGNELHQVSLCATCEAEGVKHTMSLLM